VFQHGHRLFPWHRELHPVLGSDVQRENAGINFRAFDAIMAQQTLHHFERDEAVSVFMPNSFLISTAPGKLSPSPSICIFVGFK
jgi:hypothetical protein